MKIIQKIKKIKPSLFSSLISNFYIFITITAFLFLIWLVMYMSEEVNNNPIYIPKQKTEIFNKILQSLKIDGTWTEANNSENLYNKLNIEESVEKDDFEDLIENGSMFNESLIKLYQDGFLKYKYQLDIGTMIFDLNKTKISKDTLIGLNQALRYFQVHNRKLYDLNWAEKNKNFNSSFPPYASIPDKWFIERNPWLGLPGCVYLSSNQSDKLFYFDNKNSEKLHELCSMKEMLPQKFGNITSDNIFSSGNEDILTPPNLSTIYNDLSAITTMTNQRLLEDYNSFQKNKSDEIFDFSEQKVNFHGANVNVAFSSKLTINSDIQNIAQKTALCATGSNEEQCRNYFNAPIDRRMRTLYENALVRNVGIAILDVNTQEIEALGSSHTSCFAYDYEGNSIKNEECPSLWKRDVKPDKLLNHAVYGEYQPGSLVKIVQGLGLVRAFPTTYGNPTSPDYQILKQKMAHSTTHFIVNALFCQENGGRFDANGTCQGMRYFATSASDLGWNNNCTDEHCGKRDILFGSDNIHSYKFQNVYFSGRVMTDARQVYNNFSYTDAEIKRTLQSSRNGTWDQVTNYPPPQSIGLHRHDSYGEGNALVTPLGVANMTSRLLSAANGNRYIQDAHIIKDIWDIKHAPIRPVGWRETVNDNGYTPKKSLPINQNEASIAANLFIDIVKPGATGYSACKEVGGIDCANTTNIMGKTGTPGSTNSFNMKTIQQCKPNESNKCEKHPFKSFVMGYKDSNGIWSKVIAVSVERNWNRRTNRVDAETLSNPAAIIALEIYKRLQEANQ